MEYIEIFPENYPTTLLPKDWSQRKCFYLKNSTEFVRKVHKLDVYDDDVWLVTLPKCGTTWMQELLWLVLNDYDFETAKSEHLEVRTPFLEFDFRLNGDMDTAFRPVEQLKSPRLIKSHLPLPLLPAQIWSKKPKLIYVYRNPKDSLVSNYYHARSVGHSMDKSCEEVVNEYIEQSSTAQQPFDHVTEFYALRNEPWVYYTSFERMKSNLREVILEVCEFLGKTISEEKMRQMLQHLSFENMKNNSKTNHKWEFEQVRKKRNIPYEHHNFVRKGKVGGYKEDLSTELIAKCDKWIDEELKPFNVTLAELLLSNKH